MDYRRVSSVNFDFISNPNATSFVDMPYTSRFLYFCLSLVESRKTDVRIQTKQFGSFSDRVAIATWLNKLLIERLQLC